MNVGRRERQGLLVSGNEKRRKMILLLMRRARMMMRMGTFNSSLKRTNPHHQTNGQQNSSEPERISNMFVNRFVTMGLS